MVLIHISIFYSWQEPKRPRLQYTPPSTWWLTLISHLLTKLRFLLLVGVEVVLNLLLLLAWMIPGIVVLWNNSLCCTVSVVAIEYMCSSSNWINGFCCKFILELAKKCCAVGELCSFNFCISILIAFRYCIRTEWVDENKTFS